MPGNDQLCARARCHCFSPSLHIPHCRPCWPPPCCRQRIAPSPTRWPLPPPPVIHRPCSSLVGTLRSLSPTPPLWEAFRANQPLLLPTISSIESMEPPPEHPITTRACGDSYPPPPPPPPPGAGAGGSGSGTWTTVTQDVAQAGYKPRGMAQEEGSYSYPPPPPLPPALEGATEGYLNAPPQSNAWHGNYMSPPPPLQPPPGAPYGQAGTSWEDSPAMTVRPLRYGAGGYGAGGGVSGTPSMLPPVPPAASISYPFPEPCGASWSQPLGRGGEPYPWGPASIGGGWEGRGGGAWAGPHPLAPQGGYGHGHWSGSAQ